MVLSLAKWIALLQNLAPNQCNGNKKTCVYSHVGEIVDTSQLRQQQITLGLLKAARVLCSRQDNLRQILSHQASSSEGSSTFSLQHLMCSAIKPSPIKALFDREELEVRVSIGCMIIQTGQRRNMKSRYVHPRYSSFAYVYRKPRRPLDELPRWSYMNKNYK